MHCSYSNCYVYLFVAPRQLLYLGEYQTSF